MARFKDSNGNVADIRILSNNKEVGDLALDIFDGWTMDYDVSDNAYIIEEGEDVSRYIRAAKRMASNKSAINEYFGGMYEPEVTELNVKVEWIK